MRNAILLGVVASGIISCQSTTVYLSPRWEDVSSLLTQVVDAASTGTSSCGRDVTIQLPSNTSLAQIRVSDQRPMLSVEPHCESCNIQLYAPVESTMMMTAQFLSSLHYSNAMLITGRRCRWSELDVDIYNPLFDAITDQNVTLHAHGFDAAASAACHDLDHAKFSVYWLLPTTVDGAVAALVSLWNGQALSQRHLLVFTEGLTTVTWYDIMTSLRSNAADEALKTWLLHHALIVSDYPSQDQLSGRLAPLNLSMLAQERLINDPALLRVADGLLEGLRLVDDATCAVTAVVNGPHPITGSKLSWEGGLFENADVHLRQPGLEADVSQVRAMMQNGNVQFFDPQGNGASRPYLMLEGNPDLYPVDSLPVTLPFATLFQRSNPALGGGPVAASAFTLASVEFFNQLHTDELQLDMTVYDTYPNACSSTAIVVADSSIVGVCGAITSECSIAMMDELRVHNVPAISPAATTSLLSDLTTYPTFFRTTSSAISFGKAMAQLVRAAGFTCATLITDAVFRANREIEASLRAEAAATDITLSYVRTVPSDDTDADGYRKLLIDVWQRRGGVLIVNLFSTQAARLVAVAEELRMLDAGFLWIMSQISSNIQLWSPTNLDRLQGRMLTLKALPPDTNGPLGKAFVAFESSWNHQSFLAGAVSRPYTLRFADDVAMFTHVALQHLHEYGFGWDVNLTRAALTRGLRNLTGADNAIAGISTPELYFEQDQASVLETALLTLRDGQFFSVGHVNEIEAAIDHTRWSNQGFSCQGPEFPQVSIDATSTSGSSRLGSNEAAALAAALVICVILITVLSVLIFKRHTQASKSPQYDFTDLLAELANSMTSQREAVVPIEVNRRRVELSANSKLGTGAFGAVFGGVIHPDKGQRDKGDVAAAVKVLNADLNAVSSHQMYFEAAILSQFLGEPHIVQLLGVVTVGDPKMILMELCNQGSLYDFMRRELENDQQVTWREKLTFCSNVCDGMRVIAQAGCLHTDLAARNVLLSDGVAKVCDFGMSRSSHYYLAKSSRAIPVRWTAPEALDGLYSTKSDVWSFGIFMWEVATNCQTMPYPTMSTLDVATAVRNGHRLGCPLLCPEQVFAVMASCWRGREQRPSFNQLLPVLEQMAVRDYDSSVNVEHEILLAQQRTNPGTQLFVNMNEQPTTATAAAAAAQFGARRTAGFPHHDDGIRPVSARTAPAGRVLRGRGSNPAPVASTRKQGTKRNQERERYLKGDYLRLTVL